MYEFLAFLAVFFFGILGLYIFWAGIILLLEGIQVLLADAPQRDITHEQQDYRWLDEHHSKHNKKG